MRAEHKIVVLGGDERQIFMAQALAASGADVAAWGLGECDERIFPAHKIDGWREGISFADTVVLPLPMSMDGVRLFCPRLPFEKAPRLVTLVANLASKQVLGGKIPPEWQALAKERGFFCRDYFAIETLQMRNALPTVEGALSVALEELPVTLSGSEVAVLGYGRIASLLAEKLAFLGADVTVYARKSSDRVHAELRRLRTASLPSGEEAATPIRFSENCRLIFNTVPHRILSHDVLQSLPRTCILIDLASAPGGWDHADAVAIGLRTVWATALPGKCFPESAGKILADTIQELL